MSFLVMHTYKSYIAGWAAVVFGFIAIITMMVPGLERFRANKTAKPKA
jgi:hypothetical protein